MAYYRWHSRLLVSKTSQLISLISSFCRAFAFLRVIKNLEILLKVFISVISVKKTKENIFSLTEIRRRRHFSTYADCRKISEMSENVGKCRKMSENRRQMSVSPVGGGPKYHNL